MTQADNDISALKPNLNLQTNMRATAGALALYKEEYQHLRLALEGMKSLKKARWSHMSVNPDNFVPTWFNKMYDGVRIQSQIDEVNEQMKQTARRIKTLQERYDTYMGQMDIDDNNTLYVPSPRLPKTEA